MTQDPTQDSLPFGDEQPIIHHLMGKLSDVIHQHKFVQKGPQHLLMVDLNMGNGAFAEGFVDTYLKSPAGQTGTISISGTGHCDDQLEEARSRLRRKNALGQLFEMDPSNTVGQQLRNKLGCVGGADIVAYAHAAYPSRLPSHKLPRMVDRLGDLIAGHGAVVTVHHHGASDVDEIKSKLFKKPCFSAPGRNCNTQHKLESAFSEANLHSFAITVPNYMTVPANLKAIEAIFTQQDAELSGRNAGDAVILRGVFEQIAGGKETFAEVLAEMGESERSGAIKYFADKIENGNGKTMPLGLGGGQVVVAFRSPELAAEAFQVMTRETGKLDIPAVVMPLSRGLSAGFDKKAAYGDWKEKLGREHGISNPPAVCQAERDSGHRR